MMHRTIEWKKRNNSIPIYRLARLLSSEASFTSVQRTTIENPDPRDYPSGGSVASWFDDDYAGFIDANGLYQDASGLLSLREESAIDLRLDFVV